MQEPESWGKKGVVHRSPNLAGTLEYSIPERRVLRTCSAYTQVAQFMKQTGNNRVA